MPGPPDLGGGRVSDLGVHDEGDRGDGGGGLGKISLRGAFVSLVTRLQPRHEGKCKTKFQANFSGSELYRLISKEFPFIHTPSLLY